MKPFIFLVSFLLFFNCIQAQNNALHFDGVNDFLVMPANAKFDVSAGTIEFWIKPDTITSAGSCILGNRGSATRFSFHILPNAIGVWNDSYFCTLPYDFSAKLWYHIAIVSNGVSATQFFVNGISIGSCSDHYSATTGMPFVVGAVKNGTNPPQELFKGIIDDIRIWNTQRTQAQITANKDLQLTGSEPGLTVLYKFEQGTPGGDNTAITTITDSIVSNISGTLYNFAMTGSTSNFVPGLLTDIASSAGLAWQLTGNSGTNPTTNGLGTTDSQRLAFKTYNVERMTLLPSGFLGVGTSAPDHNFSVIGEKGFNVGRPGGINSVFFEPVESIDWGIGVWNGGWNAKLTLDAKNVVIGTRGSNARLGIGTANPQAALDVKGNIFTTGKIAIGTTDTSKFAQYALAVNGSAIFTKIKVKMYDSTGGWADYVFKKNYILPSINEVDNYIKQNGHLKDVPTTADVLKNGVDIGENQVVLLRKIEELTLYVIQQNKRLEAQQRQIDALKRIRRK